ncbi:peptidase [uncultured Mediterranean phage uvMED]|nr:peptidase [uncultured Mediterranean phage uvMED]
MDPISIATASFAALKAGIAAGKEISSLSKEIGKLWGAIDQARNDHSSAQNSPFRGSSEEEAMDTFINLQKAKDFEDQLRSIILETRGYGAWQELIKLRADIKERKRKAEIARKLARRERIETIGKIVLTLLGFGAVGGLLTIGVLIFQKQGVL